MCIRDSVHKQCDREPRYGFVHLSEISIGNDDILTVIEHEPDVVSDAFTPPTPWIIESLRLAYKKTGNARLQALGEIMNTCLLVEAQRLVLMDAQDECLTQKMARENLEAAAKRGDLGALAVLR